MTRCDTTARILRRAKGSLSYGGVSRRTESGFNHPFAALEALKVKAPAPARKAPPTPRAPRAEPPLTDEELFLREVGSLAPLARAAGRVGAPAVDPAQRPRRPSDDAEVLAELADLCGGD